jgi:hypothetical protein
MVTYKIEAKRAASLRRQLLQPYGIALALTIAAFMMLGSGTGTFWVLALAAAGSVVWAVVAFWRALWALWEWPGIALGVGVAFAVAVVQSESTILGLIANVAFFIYVYMQLGKQSGEVKIEKRERFEE